MVNRDQFVLLCFIQKQRNLCVKISVFFFYMFCFFLVFVVILLVLSWFYSLFIEYAENASTAIFYLLLKMEINWTSFVFTASIVNSIVVFLFFFHFILKTLFPWSYWMRLDASKSWRLSYSAWMQMIRLHSFRPDRISPRRTPGPFPFPVVRFQQSLYLLRLPTAR